jgi:hypothetical protein
MSCPLYRRTILRCSKEGVLHQLVWSSTHVQVIEVQPVQGFPHGRVEGRLGSVAHVLTSSRCRGIVARCRAPGAATTAATTTITAAATERVGGSLVDAASGRGWHP